MKLLIHGAAFFCLALSLTACDSNTENAQSFTGSETIIVTENHEVEAFSRLSYEEKVHEASAILVVRYDRDENGEIVPIVTHRRSRFGDDQPPYQVGDVYMSSTQQFLIESSDGDLRHLEEGAVILFKGQPPRERTSSFIHDGHISGEAPVPVGTVVAGFDGGPIANGRPAEVLTLEADLSKGESGPVSTTLSNEEKNILVGILERYDLRHQVVSQGDQFVVGWVGSDEALDKVMEEFIEACD